MDLSQFAQKQANADTGNEIEIYSPTDQPMGLFVTVAGEDSEVFKRCKKSQDARQLNAISRAGRATKLTPEQLEANELEQLATVSLSWRRETPKGEKFNTWQFGDEELECNKANAMRVYRELTFIKEQVQAAMRDRASFFSK